jgi:solute carrier family 35 protein F1/2
MCVLILITGVSSQALTNQGIYAPTTQAFFNYCLLAIVFGTSQWICPLLPKLRHKQRTKSHNAASLHPEAHNDDETTEAAGAVSGNNTSSSSSSSRLEAAAQRVLLCKAWPSFAALALIDAEANVLVTKAYQYTSLTSVTLLDCFTIPCVMLLSWLLLRARYKAGHYIGAACCIAGLAVLVLGDSKGSLGGSSSTYQTTSSSSGAVADPTTSIPVGSSSSNSGSGSSPLLGDSLVLLGALLYSVCNVTQELLLADVQPGQLLAMLGVFGALISGAQAALLEHHMLATVHWGSTSVLLPMAGFAAAMFVFYSSVPCVLMLGGATVLNLGLLTSDGWAALARYLWFGGFEGWSAQFFVASLLLVAGGLLLYTLTGSPQNEDGVQAEPGPGTGGVGGLGGVLGAVCGGERGVAGGGAAAVGRQVAYSRLEMHGDVEEQQELSPAPLRQLQGEQ